VGQTSGMDFRRNPASQTCLRGTAKAAAFFSLDCVNFVNLGTIPDWESVRHQSVSSGFFRDLAARAMTGIAARAAWNIAPPP